MDLNINGIAQTYGTNAGTGSHAGGSINRMEPFSSYCFGAGTGTARTMPLDIPTPGRPLRRSFARAQQSPGNVQPVCRFLAKGQEDARQVAALLKNTRGVAERIACTTDRRRFLVQHQGCIFNFCLNRNGDITASAMVHPTSCLQRDFERDFASVAGQAAPVFQKMESARQILNAYLAGTANASGPASAASGGGASRPDDFAPFGVPPLP